jgi:peptidoglycan hydrolase CwlO-like protein
LRRTLAALTIVGAVVALQVSDVAATNPAPAQCSTANAPASPTRLVCPPDPNQAAYEQLKGRLGDDIAKALDAQKRLSTTLDLYTAIAQGLSNQVTQEETTISNLEDQIAKLDTQIQDTQDRIDVEKQQVAVMARAIYRQPDSLWVLIARTGNLQQALLATSDMVVAGQRAHTLQTKLEADLAKLESDRKARQDDLDKENANRDLLVANLNALQDVMATQSDISGQLSDLVGRPAARGSGAKPDPEVLPDRVDPGACRNRKGDVAAPASTRQDAVWTATVVADDRLPDHTAFRSERCRVGTTIRRLPSLPLWR